MTIEFWLTSLVVILVPGTGVIYTIASGITGGAKASLWAASGCTLGIIPHILASLVGLSALLNASAVAFSALKYLGVAYLLFLAWRMWTDRTDLAELAVAEKAGGLRTFRRAFLMNILNPKLTIFFLAFLPQFVRHDSDVPFQMVGLGLAFMALTWGVFIAYGLLATTLREKFLRKPRFFRGLNRTFAGLLAFFGVQLALTDRS